MIVLDTHIWIWWIQDDVRLDRKLGDWIVDEEISGLVVSAISCWEVAKLAEYGKISLPLSVSDWLAEALSYPGIRLQELTPEIAVESTQLPPDFHKDPADQIIVATARVLNCPLVTIDQRIRAYPHVVTERSQ